MIGRCYEQTSGWPRIEFLQQHRHQSFEFPDITVVISTLRDGIEFIEKEHTVLGLRVRKHLP